jgi:alkylhydroperoxidase/carboxymuconolactone decarboxylase family protein YurZ
MAIVRLMQEHQATGKVKEIFEEIKAAFGLPFVPEIFRALGNRPDQLEATWTQVKGLFQGGSLDVRTKLGVALGLAAAQGSSYFVSAYTAALRRLGAGDEEISEFLQVASLAASLNTLASGLKLEPEL